MFFFFFLIPLGLIFSYDQLIWIYFIFHNQDSSKYLILILDSISIF